MSKHEELDLGSNTGPALNKIEPVGVPELTRIIIEENTDIPPTGLFVGLNGRGYLIRSGEPVSVPKGVVEILDHAITTVSVTNPQTGQIIGSRKRHRFPFRILRAGQSGEFVSAAA